MRVEIAGSEVETVKDGFANLPTGPGLGTTVNEVALEKYKELRTVKGLALNPRRPPGQNTRGKQRRLTLHRRLSYEAS